jgi:HPt (histidine-containing phosphotransfer) domain-containing protein
MNRVIEISLDVLTEEIGIDKDAITELLKVFCGEMTVEIQQLKEQSYHQDWTGIKKTVHSIKGVAANLYLTDMLEATELVDIKLKRNEYADIQSYIDNLCHIFDATIEGINNTLNK